jgi:glycosyltransferase involved in cell wall biosynthesis
MINKLERIPEIIPDKIIIPQNNKTISYIIPTYNMESTIEKTIKSCIQQNYPYKEIIVIDDGSIDNTELIIKKYKNVKYIKQENMGTAQALNRGIKESSGQYLSWISADDYYIDKQATTKRIALLESNENLDFVYSDFYDLINNRRNYYKSPNFNTKEEAYKYNKEICVINGSTLLMRRKVIYNIGLFNYCYRYRQDYDYWFRLLKHHKGIAINEPLIERTNEVNIMARELVDVDGFDRKVFNLELEKIIAHSRFFDETRPTICAMICMKNEDDLIEGCLDDLIQWVDKIVIFNDGSTDFSPYRIHKYPKVREIYNSLYKGNIRTESQDRQKLLEMAQAQNTDWILFIDTDEVFEHSMKWSIVDLMNNQNAQLYSFLELNFWRGYTHYRIDELWLKGWFKRLFRNKSGLKIYDQNEHCGGVPYNINAETIPVESIRVKHYGFTSWQRNVDRYTRRMERDPFNPKTGKGGAAFYDRMLNEEGLQLQPYEGDIVRRFVK